MGQRLAATSPAAREVFARADEVLGYSLSRLCFAGPAEELRQTHYAQPALLVASLAALDALTEMMGARPPAAAVAGHSLGEYTALVAAGALALDDTLRAVQRRGELMARAARSEPGTMVAVLGLADRLVEEICATVSGQVVVANYNAPGQVVISGASAHVARAAEQCRAAGARRVVPLPVGGAFHSPLMRMAADEFCATVEELRIESPRIPVVGNVTGGLLGRADEVREDLRAQLRSPVRWTASVQTLADRGVDHFLELGPGQVLRGLIGRTLPTATVHSAGDDLGVLTAVEWLNMRNDVHIRDVE
ncbi:MAG: ACP S-malonyltransferase [Chloroflexi bacterium]|nr:ACP S-malonyltransferase [Chloroflexota bacterium]